MAIPDRTTTNRIASIRAARDERRLRGPRVVHEVQSAIPPWVSDFGLDGVFLHILRKHNDHHMAAQRCRELIAEHRDARGWSDIPPSRGGVS